MDNRITGAIQTIGSVAETDLNPDDIQKLCDDLAFLAAYTYNIRWSKYYRLAGDIENALFHEKYAEQHYEGLSKQSKWQVKNG